MSGSDQPRATLQDVARLAGVSRSTASLAFSGAGPVSEATRARVMAASAELGYSGPDPRARSLRQGRSGVVGIVFDEGLLSAFRDPVNVATLDGIATGLGDGSNGLLLLTETGAVESSIASAAIDAAVLMGCSPVFDRVVLELRRRGVPVVSIEGGPAGRSTAAPAAPAASADARTPGLVDAKPADAATPGLVDAEPADVGRVDAGLVGAREGGPQGEPAIESGAGPDGVPGGGSTAGPGLVDVALDNVEASEALARHLHGLGHRRVGVLTLATDAERETGPVTPEREAGMTTAVTADRLRGVRRVFPDAVAVSSGFNSVEEAVRGARLLLAPADPGDPQATLPGATDPGVAGRAQGGERPTAVLAQSDLLAVGVLQVAAELGLRVPEDLSLTGFDGVPIEGLAGYDLTTMVQPAGEKGREAGRAVRALIAGEDVSSVVFHCEFHLGATTAPPPA
ncbi:LacI family DNA-binding transcriptional regulator [Herbiconiux liukaitaii]|uniref:LacI family DNA-binding transcriptional regulator n=1 Tax=Herbiconiux liukaitaii TaxID=3342799 RepID=UPI0035BB3068